MTEDDLYPLLAPLTLRGFFTIWLFLTGSASGTV